MDSATLHPIVRHLRRVVAPAPEVGLSDAELLDRWRTRRDEAAFEVLVWRHGPMVLGVCRRVLRQAQDAEDAFQATFLALVRKADTIHQRQALPGWLYRVAYRVALQVRATRRAAQPLPDCVGDVGPDHSALDDEIARLPEKYRLAVVLCYLQGHTTDEAAHQLGCPRGTVATRLAWARRRLKARLTSPAVPLSAGGVQEAVRTATGGVVAARIAALAEGVFRPLWISRIHVVITLLLTGIIAAGIGLAEPAAQPPMKPVIRRDPEPLPDGVLARLGSGRLRHTDRLRDMIFAPDGKSLVTGGDGTLRLWDLSTGQLLRRYELLSDWILRIAFSPDGKTLTVLEGHHDMTWRRLDVATGRERSRIEFPDTRDVALSPRGDRVAAVVRKENTVRIVDAATGKETLRLPYSGEDGGLAFAPDGRSLALADAAGLRVCDATTGKTLATLNAKASTARRILFSPDGQLLATIQGPTGNHACVWDVQTSRQRLLLDGPESFDRRFCFSADSRWLAVSSVAGPIRLWDVGGGGVEKGRTIETPSEIRHLAFSPQGRTLATSTPSGTVLLWDVDTGKRLPVSADPVEPIRHLRFTADSKQLVGSSPRWHARDVGTGRLVRQFADEGHPGEPTLLSPDESMLAVADRAGTITLHDAKSGRVLHTLEGRDGRIWVLRFSPDGQRLFAAGFSKRITVWDLTTVRLERRLESHTDPVSKLAVSPDGRLLASATYAPPFEDFAIRLWNVADGRLLRTLSLRRGSAHDLAFSLDGRLLAAVGGRPGLANPRGEVQVWDVATGRERGEFVGHTERATCVAFSPDGRMLVTGSIDRTVRLWEVASGKERKVYRGHEGAVESVAFAPDGRSIAAASPDAPVFIWNVRGKGDAAR